MSYGNRAVSRASDVFNEYPLQTVMTYWLLFYAFNILLLYDFTSKLMNNLILL